MSHFCQVNSKKIRISFKIGRNSEKDSNLGILILWIGTCLRDGWQWTIFIGCFGTFWNFFINMLWAGGGNWNEKIIQVFDKQQFHQIFRKSVKWRLTYILHIDYSHLTRFLRNKRNKCCHIAISRDFSHKYHSKKWTRRNLYLVFFGWGLHKWSLERHQLHSKNLTGQAVLVLVLG